MRIASVAIATMAKSTILARQRGGAADSAGHVALSPLAARAAMWLAP
jgi:hypothetical protein